MKGTPRNVFGPQSANTSRSTLLLALVNMPFVLTAVATFSSESGTNFPRFVRNASRSAKPSGLICFSKPTGMSELGDGWKASISLRWIATRLPSASTTSIAVLLSAARRPVTTRPSSVDTV